MCFDIWRPSGTVGKRFRPKNLRTCFDSHCSLTFPTNRPLLGYASKRLPVAYVYIINI